MAVRLAVEGIMTRADLLEAAAIWRATLAVLVASPADAATTEAAEVRRVCGAASAVAEASIRAAFLSVPMRACFDAAYLAGASAEAFARVRALPVVTGAQGEIASILAVLVTRLSLAGECKAIADATLTTGAQADAITERLRVAFDAATDLALDMGDGEAFKALAALQSAVVRDLAERGRRLPRQVAYSTGRRLPSAILAQRLYSDAARAEELVRENGAIHPLFMPSTGRALSA